MDGHATVPKVQPLCVQFRKTTACSLERSRTRDPTDPRLVPKRLSPPTPTPPRSPRLLLSWLPEAENRARRINDDREDTSVDDLDGLLHDVRAERLRLGRSRLDLVDQDIGNPHRQLARHRMRQHPAAGPSPTSIIV